MQRQLTENVVMRILRVEDASALAEGYIRNRAHLEPWDPLRSEEFFSHDWQAADISKRLSATEAGEGYPFGLFDGEVVVGRFNLIGIVRGAFQSASLGYWVDGQRAGQGLATAAVEAVIAAARDELQLHRIEASTLLHNKGSQRVLLKTGFAQIGVAPRYLKIAGVWQDHNLYQNILHE